MILAGRSSPAVLSHFNWVLLIICSRRCHSFPKKKRRRSLPGSLEIRLNFFLEEESRRVDSLLFVLRCVFDSQAVCRGVYRCFNLVFFFIHWAPVSSNVRFHVISHMFSFYATVLCLLFTGYFSFWAH